MSPSTAITKLLALGWNETRIAKEVGIAQSSVSRIHNDLQEPKYSTGVALIALAEKSTKRGKK